MKKKKMKSADYPLSENHNDSIFSKNGVKLSDLTLESLLNGSVRDEDIQISAETLKYQSQISHNAGRKPLGYNFERAAEMVNIPNELIMEIYEKLRPGRSKNSDELLSYANLLRNKYRAPLLADFILEAANVYKKRGLYRTRF